MNVKYVLLLMVFLLGCADSKDNKSNADPLNLDQKKNETVDLSKPEDEANAYISDKHKLILKDIIEFFDIVRISFVTSKINNQKKQIVWIHPSYEDILLDNLCKKLGYGKGHGRTGNASQAFIYDDEMYLYKDANFISGFELKKLLTADQRNQKPKDLERFFCLYNQSGK